MVITCYIRDKGEIMIIKKFKYVKNGNVVYAVLGANNSDEALEKVYMYKHSNKNEFYDKYTVYNGLIEGDNLYVLKKGNTKKRNGKICYIVASKSIQMEEFMI